MFVTLIVVAYENTSAQVEKIVSSFRNDFRNDDGEVEIVIVQNDNNPPLHIAGARTASGHGNVGFGAGVRIGLDQAAGQYVVIANPDCFFTCGSARNLLARAADQPDNTITTALILNQHGKPQYANYTDWTLHIMRRALLPWNWFVLTVLDSVRLPRGCKVPGTAFAIERELAKTLGPFDPAFFLYGEDRDLSRRARKAGIELRICRSARVIHIGGVSAAKAPGIVTRGQADAALLIAERRYGTVGRILVGLELVLFARSRSERGIRRAALAGRSTVD